MKIGKNAVVTMTYDICKANGEIVESSDITGPISFMFGTGAIIKGLDTKLEGMEEGAEATFELPPEEAFGRAEDAPTNQISRGEFPKDAKLEEGAQFEASLPSGGSIVLRVKEFDDENVTVQMLHPLAGESISMSVKIVGVREATIAERTSGKVQSKPPPPPGKS
jgi:FKBP-type peptidyl-prolyl cis-trans isomerase SlyD